MRKRCSQEIRQILPKLTPSQLISKTILKLKKEKYIMTCIIKGIIDFNTGTSHLN